MFQIVLMVILYFGISHSTELDQRQLLFGTKIENFLDLVEINSRNDHSKICFCEFTVISDKPPKLHT